MRNLEPTLGATPLAGILHITIPHVQVCSMLGEVKGMSKNGSLQARLDLEACKLLFSSNMNKECRGKIQNMIDRLPTSGIT